MSTTTEASSASIAYGLDDFYYNDKFTEEDFLYEHYLKNDLYGELYVREEESRESPRFSSYHGKRTAVEHYLRADPALVEEAIPRGRPIYTNREQMASTYHHHMQGYYQPSPMRQHRPAHLAQYQMSRKQAQQHYVYKRAPTQQNGPSMPAANKKFRKKTHKHAGKENSKTRKIHKGQHVRHFKQMPHHTTRVRIHGDSWIDDSEGYVGLVGKGGHKIGIYRTDKIDPLLPVNNDHKEEKDKHATMTSSNFNTYHAGAFWRLFGVEINNVEDFRQTVGDRIVGFAVKPDGKVVVKTLSFAANAAVNIVKVLDVLEKMRTKGFRSRSVQELTTEGTIQAIVEQWISGKKVIEMSL